MKSHQRIVNLAGWLVFAVATFVYYLSAESSGSLWDCGEFVSGAYKLQVVHPPGAPLFLIVARLFTLVGEALGGVNGIAFSVNLLSGICTAFAGTFVCWTTILFGKLAINGRDEEPSQTESLMLAAAGIIAGLCTTWSTSNWFSAVEGEVYAMSTMFTFLTLWASVKWYALPNKQHNDRWLMFAVYASCLSIGVHLLSLLTFPAIALLYYYKKYDRHTVLGSLAAFLGGVVFITVIQKLVITGVPTLWKNLEILCVNGLGLPFSASLVPLIAIVGGLFYAAYRYSDKLKNAALQNMVVGLLLAVTSFTTVGVVVLRAKANTPINMNNPSDPVRLLPYLNREQYGERPLLYGPQFTAQPVDNVVAERYGRVGDSYQITDKKIDYVFDSKDKGLFPRMGHYEGDKAQMYRPWMGLNDKEEIPEGRPGVVDNVSFFVRYQMGWMYWRYFFWNFVGRQNFNQGITPVDPASGNWYSGVGFIDNARLYNGAMEPEAMKNDAGRNRYYFIPLILGLLGVLFQWKKRDQDFYAMLAFFLITGLGIIVYSNQPPIEPRERDYVLVGSFSTFCIWIGLGALFLFDWLRKRINPTMAMAAGLGLGALAPALMVTQNFDDSSRKGHFGARDYAANFLESCAPNAILFTYGDNDTYPLWYAQEVEGIRTDIRVVNLSLIAVDWYIDQLRRKVNNSPAIKMQLTSDQMRGFKRNQVPINDRQNPNAVVSLTDLLNFIGKENPISAGNGMTFETYAPARNIFIPIDRAKMIANKVVSATDSIVSQIAFKIDGNSLIKDDLAVLDIINNNIHDRPVYFAVTVRPDKMQGLDNFMQLEGLALRVVPVETPSMEMFGVAGSGRVNFDACTDIMTKKWKWGNFNNEKTYISPYYQPSLQSMRLTMMRASMEMVEKKDSTRAVAIAESYLKGFPNNNFRYDFNTWYLLDVMVRSSAMDKAKPHIKQLATNMAEDLKFYQSIGKDAADAGFNREQIMTSRAKDQLVNSVTKSGDAAFLAEIQKILGPFGTVTPMPQGQQ
jgi:Protein of unknown function (DUF2723)